MHVVRRLSYVCAESERRGRWQNGRAGTHRKNWNLTVDAVRLGRIQGGAAGVSPEARTAIGYACHEAPKVAAREVVMGACNGEAQ